MTRTLYDMFAATADSYPDRIAIEFPDAYAVNYAQLRGYAEALAEQIVARHGAVERIGLLAGRSLVAYAGYLAALRTGAAVVPLGPDNPPERNQRMCDAAAVDMVLAETSGSLSAAPSFGDRPAYCLSDEEVRATTWTGSLPPPGMDSNKVAYVLFTSGSTGRPKGIPIRHRQVLPFLAHNIERFGIVPGCRISHNFALTFDPSVTDLFAAWGAGATLVVPSRSQMFAPVSYLTERELTHWLSVPSAITMTTKSGQLEADRPLVLRHSVFGGERLTVDQARAWHAVAPDAPITNIYGLTELAIACTGFRLPSDPALWPTTSNGTVPIGNMYPGMESRIVDPTGELWVRGRQRFDGYLDPNDDEGCFVDGWFRTGDRVQVEDGQMVHRGRLDDQVKIHGYRVEPSEVELAMRRLDGVAEVVVLGITVDGVTDLIAGYTGRETDRMDLIRALRQMLPIYLVPRHFAHLRSLPLNDNGKIDRRAVRRMVSPVSDDACVAAQLGRSESRPKDSSTSGTEITR